MTTQPVPADRTPYPTETTPASTTSGLIAWALGHSDRTVRRHGEQAHDALGWLRTRHTADQELAKADAEEKELEERLAAVRARKAQLAPKGKPVRDYVPAAVRAWARSQGLPVPDKGQIPATVLTAWRARDTTEASRVAQGATR
ncbi:histone-like nucleoid-structuring protein Lsr2 [Streptomyces sp. NPDC051657]|uniref:Lsr2 family DNA-binding protein n=1 Tax=unclassified Streptomyces TaxID=2593676 RepID=UPI003422849F